MASNSLSMQPPHSACRLPPDDEVRASQPFTVVWRQIGCEFELEVSRDFGWNLPREGEAARRIESDEIVDCLDRDKARLPRAAHRHLFLQEAAHLQGARRDPRNILQSKVLPDLVQRIGRTVP